MREKNKVKIEKQDPKLPWSRSYDPDFLVQDNARIIRLVWEYLEPQTKLEQQNIDRTVVFFGSARTKSLATAQEVRDQLRQRSTNQSELQAAEYQVLMAQYYEDAVEIAQRLAEWSKTLPTPDQFVVCSGGGPGIMEAANKGSHLANSPSIGLNISLPFEQQANPYVSPQLDFDFHYFFMRKLWFADLAEAILVFPGGFGTCDELMEILTLVQTRKIQKKIPILVYGREYWNEVINFSAFVKWGMISESDLDLFHFVDTPDEAVNYIQQNIRMVNSVETDQNLDGHI